MGAMNAIELEERVRSRLSASGVQAEEKRMFGALVFMVGGEMLVGVRNQTGLLVRSDPSRCAELTARPGARTATMGQRDMGPGWLDVDAAVLDTDQDVTFWLDVARSRPR